MSAGDAWLVMWACYCSDARVDRDDLPTTCPFHGSERVTAPAKNHPDQVPMTLGHRCGQRACRAELAAAKANREQAAGEIEESAE